MRGFVLRVTIFTLERFHGIRGILQCRLQTGFIFFSLSLSLFVCPSVSVKYKRQYATFADCKIDLEPILENRRSLGLTKRGGGREGEKEFL